jgi:post-segregation antitoxin (ccd killing protein)
MAPENSGPLIFSTIFYVQTDNHITKVVKSTCLVVPCVVAPMQRIQWQEHQCRTVPAQPRPNVHLLQNVQQYDLNLSQMLSYCTSPCIALSCTERQTKNWFLEEKSGSAAIHSFVHA